MLLKLDNEIGEGLSLSHQQLVRDVGRDLDHVPFGKLDLLAILYRIAQRLSVWKRLGIDHRTAIHQRRFSLNDNEKIRYLGMHLGLTVLVPRGKKSSARVVGF